MRALCLLCLSFLVWGCQTSDAFRGTVMPDTPVTDFVLVDQDGGDFKSSEHRGKVMVFFFGYTFCPDVCPLTLSTWKRVYDALGGEAEEVSFVYVTVDPERDTPERLKAHLSIFSPTFFGLTGSPQALSDVYADFGVYAEKTKIAESAAGYLINHSTRMFVVDRKGMLRLLISHDAPVEDIVHDLELMLKTKT